MREFQEDRRKLKELILYISKKGESDPTYGSTLLNKALFFADFLAYAKFGNPITGALYIREKRGPVPRPMRAPSVVLTEMKRAGELRLHETQIPLRGKVITRVTPIAQREPDLSVFSAQEIELVDQVTGTFHGWPAGAISKYTHELPQWHTVPLNETIPYELVFVAQDQRMSEAETNHGLELARRYGWPLSKSGR
jgi:hypothetical protein